MNREPLHCRICARFIPDAQLRKDEEGPGHCEGYDRPAHSTDTRCVLFNERGAWKTRKAQAPPEQRRANETISRASAPTSRVTASTTT